ncbi:hypothetical protein DL766_000699 [Monosporascus sp. MC13-8B]|uniref:Uncharacterized protein n=1 Tax=Monosporascus cannonballus TaxID=155416 RepID=A0ABY0H9B4_9PEZI|nr:hypothetical protein DL763_009860 [Monosporascus cannonballus]RYO88140.1 hypothetical protein DL762_003890 [Monosporascus cannonballus]RYP38890.1 hypothetical protein DL766_000699 [Monosporascus sp. MC13-8B]
MPALSRIHDVYGPSPSTSSAEIGDHGGTKLGEWSSLIGIITAIVGNVLIALALNVQRYAHIQLHRRRVEARERARAALKRVQNGPRASYGATEGPSPDAQEDDHEDGAAQETHPLVRSFHSSNSAWTENGDGDSKVVSSYLKSPAWWLGQVLMTVGEMGNFLAYGFAPASIVSPLGVFALISNCVIAPLFFGERFRKRDFWGVVIAVAGAVTVVLSANHEENKLDPHDVWDAIATMEFEIYLAVTTALILVLMWASPKYGHRTILIDLGLVGLFGGYTALTTKGVSSMLSSTLLKAFTTPVTYGLLFVLLVTAVMQVRYVNKALQRFDSTQVIPIQFVLFTLSVIVGSAVLYRDFERTTETQAAKFVGGCLLTFFGVFLITSGRPPQDEEDQLSDDENVEETIGLRHREAVGASSQPTGAPRHEDEQPRAESTIKWFYNSSARTPHPRTTYNAATTFTSRLQASYSSLQQHLYISLATLVNSERSGIGRSRPSRRLVPTQAVDKEREAQSNSKRCGRATPLGHGEDQPAEHKSLRRRAHSLGNTLEGFFGRKRRRRNTLTEGQSAENQAGNAPSEV